MTVKDAKKILSGDVAVISPEILQKAMKIILSELDKAEKKIIDFEKNSLEDLPGEIWRDIKDYEGLYQVSNFWRVKSLARGSKKILAYFKCQEYAVVSLYKNKRKKNFYVHRLVAETFIDNPKNLPIVNHKDFNKKNNCVENLEWVTQKENVHHAFENGVVHTLKGFECPFSKFNAEEIKYIRENYKPRDENFGARALAKKFGVIDATITKIVKGETYKEQSAQN